MSFSASFRPNPLISSSVTTRPHSAQVAPKKSSYVLTSTLLLKVSLPHFGQGKLIILLMPIPAYFDVTRVGPDAKSLCSDQRCYPRVADSIRTRSRKAFPGFTEE